MKSDVLERLLIDRAAGELSPDVEELLEAHLQKEPAARKEAVEIEETLRLARLALADQPAEAVVSLARSRPFNWVTSWGWAMAACFVCGLSLGIFAVRERSVAPGIASVPSRETAVTTTADESGFWSARRLRAGMSPVTMKSGNRVIWKSPVEKPELL
jgi:anti-sigma factor RsiW